MAIAGVESQGRGAACADAVACHDARPAGGGPGQVTTGLSSPAWHVVEPAICQYRHPAPKALLCVSKIALMPWVLLGICVLAWL